jgi:hypothetical protein
MAGIPRYNDGMSQGSNKKRAAVRLAFPLLLVALIAVFSAWLRISAAIPGAPVSRPKAESIAIEEVRTREGWSGKAEAHREGDWWCVTVWRDHRSPHTEYTVDVDTAEGHILEYYPPQF